MEPEVIRLYVIEDHPVIVAGLKNQFRPKRDNIEVIGNAGNVAEAIAVADPGAFDLFILDLWIDEGSPEDGIHQLRKAFPTKPIIIYTSETAVPWQKKMIKAGAMAYIIKTARRQEIKAAIEQVATGLLVMPKALIYQDQRKITFGLTHKGQRMTPNQLELVKEVASGLTLKEIAIKNGAKESTIEKTLILIRNKYNAKNTNELISILKDERII